MPDAVINLDQTTGRKFELIIGPDGNVYLDYPMKRPTEAMLYASVADPFAEGTAHLYG